MIVTIHKGNLDPRILEMQRRVFYHFGFHVEQRLMQERHGAAMDVVLKEAVEQDDNVLFVDADCIPLSAGIIHESLVEAGSGSLFGAAGYASHIKDDFVYVHPCWLAIEGYTWWDAGEPSCVPTKNKDTAAKLTEVWAVNNWSWDVLCPTHAEIPKWKLPGDKCTGKMSGIGTTFGGDQGVYHLFGGSSGQHLDLFFRKCEKVLKT